jgi:hypothetical protein
MADSLEESRGEFVEPYSGLTSLQSGLVEALPEASTSRSDYRGGGPGWAVRRITFPWFDCMPRD